MYVFAQFVIIISVIEGMKWEWKLAPRLAVLPANGHLYLRWRLPLLDNQRHCWTSSLVHSNTYRPLFWSPGPLQLSQMGKSFVMSYSADTPLRTTVVILQHFYTGIFQLLIRMKPCSHTLCIIIRYNTACVCVDVCLFLSILVSHIYSPSAVDMKWKTSLWSDLYFLHNLSDVTHREMSCFHNEIFKYAQTFTSINLSFTYAHKQRHKNQVIRQVLNDGSVLMLLCYALV